MAKEDYRFQVELSDEQFEALASGEEIVFVTMNVGGNELAITLVRKRKRKRNPIDRLADAEAEVEKENAKEESNKMFLTMVS